MRSRNIFREFSAADSARKRGGFPLSARPYIKGGNGKSSAPRGILKKQRTRARRRSNL
jgi:hypothetical protein